MKQVIIVRSDLKMGKGKIAAQACHASIGSFKRTEEDKIRKWELEGSKKVIVSVNSLDELLEIYRAVKEAGISNYLVRDAGHTQIPAGTITCLGVGPDDDEKIDKITGDLKLL
ncbi:MULTISPECIES: aminoacyl-tRNA hydrolase [unclassified Methanothermobacter]|jgi:PTH2 family peptidyl-tRNA hydrolase|uniref:Peptidyl-tRNA hydrolase n=1 Tax=Methanothermobacter thermautotrophicus TaxID=145262 RepID=A0A7J4MVY7_METTF|nr:MULTISPECIES: aminoacyl-tRNA hydrolase [unclassified Methanothermobacter]MBC7112015.1 aminoacyl-tRNA hydrolase [Methanothermobacter sp.]HIH64901.1 aminoacyl-tRNA hydrolase [Methanothermobacter thermautotrophicus]MDK2874859.1 peptidyl-tRNA hydrolase, family [Methanothermobacter sp.]MDN5374172.1 peptidyl-tRNA hydrolase, family [Methanothermobacter sp.]BAM70797.1 peptidyl-tRNA hydrolase [Methanothermobacter sp. CaT2]